MDFYSGNLRVKNIKAHTHNAAHPGFKLKDSLVVSPGIYIYNLSFCVFCTADSLLKGH